ncbi:LEAF RUST 10 DISEASE-RESISTANCE LOCUS RECEPTOR-LIKE PROTEIN KINASE-like 1.2 [Senna tora]|uniref:LEAF RUST 10 DISEASE-RESISTANCE LOCUS RECEPTOR-LIKE PROTEIN KINASE-like 1.2 n=1 Tax=Senna tora TaxID=362788 RepID=A0A834TCY1_9FABA|nr:LEAF RUST 10 DISEASE-RESISTANCE LOCUS RECEPTOR-LIKE PROTEIN KINASE-like 1.2 [Senna tora]
MLPLLIAVMEFPIISLPSQAKHTHYVTDINYTASTLSFVDTDLFNQSCQNVTLPFILSDLDVNLSFYFKCSTTQAQTKQLLQIDLPKPIDCLNNSEVSRGLYVFETGEPNAELNITNYWVHPRTSTSSLP